MKYHFTYYHAGHCVARQGKPRLRKKVKLKYRSLVIAATRIVVGIVVVWVVVSSPVCNTLAQRMHNFLRPDGRACTDTDEYGKVAANAAPLSGDTARV